MQNVTCFAVLLSTNTTILNGNCDNALTSCKDGGQRWKDWQDTIPRPVDAPTAAAALAPKRIVAPPASWAPSGMNHGRLRNFRSKINVRFGYTPITQWRIGRAAVAGRQEVRTRSTGGRSGGGSGGVRPRPPTVRGFGGITPEKILKFYIAKYAFSCIINGIYILQRNLAFKNRRWPIACSGGSI